MRLAIASYCLLVSMLITAWWELDIRRGALSRPDRRRAEIAIHLTAEFATAALLAVGGIVLWLTSAPGLAPVALGMLLYTVIASPGYFLARREIPPVVMFAVLTAATVTAIVMTLAL